MTESFIIAPSSIHGRGGFARVPLATGARIVEYVGEKIDKTESARRCQAQNHSILGLDEESDLDGGVEWNPARYLNHSCDPNCEAICDQGRIWLVARRDILPGEELTFNYGYDLEAYREHPCHCGAVTCPGFIVAEEFFSHLRANAW
jgi:SET domain-containing protein